MRLRFALLLLLAAPAQAMPPRDILSSDAEARWVTFVLTPGNQIQFGLSVDGRPVTAVLDTGVSHSVLSRAYADAAGLSVQAGGTANAIGGGVTIGWADTRSIVLGGLTRSGGRIGVAVLPASVTGGVTAIEMLVGQDLTAGYALDIDFDAKRFRLLPSGRMPFRGDTAPLSIPSDRQVYVSEILLNGARLRPMILDTGDGNAVTLSAQAWRSAALGPAGTTTISNGLGGAIQTDLTIVRQARFGTLDAPSVEVQIEPEGGFSQTMGMAGRIGSGFLQRYHVLLDPKANRMVFASSLQSAMPPVRSTSGILVAAQGDRLRVLHVMRGSPAAATGWRKGDLICRIDGAPVPAEYAGSALSAWSIGAPGRIVALGMCDGSTRNLTLRTFY